MIVSFLVLYLPAYYLGRDYLGDHALWFALTIFMMGRGILLSLFYKREIIDLTE